MKTLSVCMIIKNEEKTLDRILSQVVQFCDELIIVDTGSDDNSIKISKKYTSNIYHLKWENDFSKARNYGLKHAKKDYIMWLDADDFISPSSIKKIKQLKQQLVDEDVIMLPYLVSFDENSNATFSYFRERIVKNNGTFWFTDPVHEVIVPHGKILHKNIPIMHKKEKLGDPKRNLNIYLSLKNSNFLFSPRNQFYFACEYYYNQMYSEAIQEFDKFLLTNGFFENKIQACINMCRIYIYQKDYLSALKYCFRSFEYDTPRSEILCEIGYIYYLQKNYTSAIYWYKLAIQKPDTNSGAFLELDKYGYEPCIQLGLCYYYLSDFQNAYKYNKKALKYKPNNSTAIYNEQFYIKNDTKF